MSGGKQSTPFKNKQMSKPNDSLTNLAELRLLKRLKKKRIAIIVSRKTLSQKY